MFSMLAVNHLMYGIWAVLNIYWFGVLNLFYNFLWKVFNFNVLGFKVDRIPGLRIEFGFGLSLQIYLEKCIVYSYSFLCFFMLGTFGRYSVYTVLCIVFCGS